jgi:hypothetical protein
MAKAWQRIAGQLGAAALALAVACSTAQAAEKTPAIIYKVLHSRSAYPQGGVYPLTLELNVAPGFHINSDRPGEPDLYPTSLILSCARNFILSPAVFPPAHPFQSLWQTNPIQMLDGKVLVRFNVTVGKAAKLGQQRLSGRLNYQACDSSSCLMLDKLDINIALNVVPAGQATQKLNPDVFKN